MTTPHRAGGAGRWLLGDCAEGTLRANLDRMSLFAPGPETGYRWIAGDLAPGDARSRSFDCSAVELVEIGLGDEGLLREAYARLWAHFGPRGEMEPLEVIRARLRRRLLRSGDFHALYGLFAVRRAGQIVAVRDATAVVCPLVPGAVVHLSHLLVEAEWRRTGLAGWLRALPLQLARRALAAADREPTTSVVLVGEMEHPDPRDPERQARLMAYGRAGFRTPDPAVTRYAQPDFRLASEIDAAGGAEPVAMRLVLRRVRREAERRIPTAELIGVVEALYAMFALDYRERDIAPLRERFRAFLLGVDSVALVDPLA
jgi:GNAT superfamily N-acetyltransferase